MKKDMTTFEMAQKAYENPGKVFVGHKPPAGAQSFFLYVMWDGRNLVFLSGDCDSKFAPLDHYQKHGYVWEDSINEGMLELMSPVVDAEEPFEWSFETDTAGTDLTEPVIPLFEQAVGEGIAAAMKKSWAGHWRHEVVSTRIG